jgi:thioredoxin-dependent peroxiredoxin
MNNEEKLSVGDAAPLFSLKDQDGKTVSLKDYKGKQSVVLIFYPGDMTPGCTIQLCGIRDNWTKFTHLDAAVFGINHADSESHNAFIKKYDYPFPLLIDTNKAISKKYGAIKKIFSATVIKRTVVVVNQDGQIAFYRHGMPKEADILKVLAKKV